MNINFSKFGLNKPVLALVSFALLSSFSGAAVSSSAHNAVHKCLQANGQYEFTDKKCVATVTAPVQEKSAPATNSSNSEVKRADPLHANVIAQPHEASPARTPLEAQPKQAPPSNGSAVPSAPPKNNNPTT